MKTRPSLSHFFCLVSVLFLGIGLITPAYADSPVTLKAGQIQTLTYTQNASVLYVLNPQGGTLWPIDQTVGAKGTDQNFSEADRTAALAFVNGNATIKLGYNGSCPVWSDHPTWARYRYELVGTLPAGIQLTCDGFLLGTPSAIGTSSFSVKIIDRDLGFITVPITFNVVESNDLQWIPELNQLFEFGYQLGTPLINADVLLRQYLKNIDTSTALSFSCSGGLPTGTLCSNEHGIEGSLLELGTSTFQMTAMNGSKSATINVRGNVCINWQNCTQDQANIDLTSAQAAAAEVARIAAAEASRVEAARAAAEQAARAAEIRAAEVAKAKSELKEILQSERKPTLDSFKAAGFEAVTEKIVNKISDELLQIPEAQRGDLTVIEDVILRVATVDKLSTPETAKFIRPADLVAIRALSADNPKKQTITFALKKLDPSRIDTYKELLAEIAKQEVIIKVRAEKIAAIQVRVAARSGKR